MLVVCLLVQIARGRLARDLAQREADDRVAAARARRVERMLLEAEAASTAASAAAAAEPDVELATTSPQPLPSLVVSPGGAVWVAKAEKQFDECFSTDDDSDESEKSDEKKKKQNTSASTSSSPNDHFGKSAGDDSPR
jgi:hypothetical protein